VGGKNAIENLLEIALNVCGTLKAHSVPHAIGGAIALGYHAEPRSTIDLDMNIFVADTEVGSVIEVLEQCSCKIDHDECLKTALERGDLRVWRGGYRIDVFLSFHPFHDQVRSRVRQVILRDIEVPILSAEDLVVFKTLFDRPKDWLDITNILVSQALDFDTSYVKLWLRELLTEEDSRFHRIDKLLIQHCVTHDVPKERSQD